MNAKMTRIVAGVVTVGLVTVLSVPVGAVALPRLRGSNETTGAARMSAKAQSAQSRRDAKRAENKAKREAQKAENLRNRIDNRLRARQARFDAANANISKRIARVAALADKVAAAGGDVTAVRAKLDEARAKLANANAIEAEFVAALNAIPNAADKKAAFQAAKATGRSAVAELKAARTALRESAHMLRAVIHELIDEAKSADASSTAE